MRRKKFKNQGDSRRYIFICSLFRALKLLFEISNYYFIVSFILSFLLGISAALSVYATDPIMEREIFRLIKEISNQKILIFITHRITNLLEFDPYIFVMKSGKIVSKGNKTDLKEDIYFNRLLSGKNELSSISSDYE